MISRPSIPTCSSRGDRLMLRAAVLALLLRACAARSCYKIDLVDWPKLPEDCTYLGLGRSKEDGDALAASLAEALPATQVTNINLMGNNIGDRGAAALAAALPHTKLEVVNLFANAIGNAGAAALADALPGSRLEKLYLDSNHIGDAGMIALAEALPRSTQLTKLKLKGNPVYSSGKRAVDRVIVWDELPDVRHRASPPPNDL